MQEDVTSLSAILDNRRDDAVGALGERLGLRRAQLATLNASVPSAKGNGTLLADALACRRADA